MRRVRVTVRQNLISYLQNLVSSGKALSNLFHKKIINHKHLLDQIIGLSNIDCNPFCWTKFSIQKKTD